MRYLYILLALTVLGEARGQSYSFSQYEVEDGLVQSSVRCFHQDQFGSLWIGTSAGISRFDGDEFFNYGLQDGLMDTHINDFLQSGDSLLIATNQGLSIFDGASFFNHQLKDSVGKVVKVRKVFRDQRDSTLLLLEDNLLAGFNGEEISLLDTLPFDAFISGMSTDTAGNIWISSYSGHLFQLKDGKLHLWGSSEPLPYRINDLYIDRQNRFWLIYQKKILLYDPDLHQISEPALDLPEFGQAFKLLQDAEGMIWVTTSSGIFSFDPQSMEIDPRSLAFPGSIIMSVYRDRDDHLWFGSFGDGFYKFKGRLITKLRQEEGLRGKTFMSLLKDSRSNYWFGSYGGGVSLLQEGQIINFGIAEGLSSNFVSSLTEDRQGRVWMGTMYGLNYYDGSRFTKFFQKDGLPSNVIYQLLAMPGDSLLVCTTGGPVYYHKGSFYSVLSDEGEVFEETILSVRQWDDERVLLLSEKSLYVLVENQVSLLLPADAFNHDFLTSVITDQRGRLWIATLNGHIYIYDPSTAELSLYNDIYKLPNTMIFSMIFLDDGSLMLGTQRGLTRLFFYEDGGLSRIQSYGKEDGFLGVEANTNALLKDEDGSLWIGSVNGIYRFHPEQEKQDARTLEPHLTGLKLFYENVDWKAYTDSVSNWYQVPYNPALSYQNNHLVFTFKAVCLDKPGQVFYSFMLEGYEENWSPPTDRNEAAYPNLPPGEYTFLVKARNPEGLWSPVATRYQFYIKPPFWQTWWFYLLALLFTLILIRLYVYFKLRRERDQRLQLELEVKGRTREIQALNDSLERRVKERTHELELSNKKFEVEFELRKLDQEKLARREREYRQLVNNLREVIFKTDTQGLLTFLNDRWQEYMGYQARESIGRHFTTFLKAPASQKSHFAEIFDSIISKELPFFEAEIRMQRKDGEIFWAKVSTRIEYDDEGEVIGTNGSLVDIDQRKKAEFALRASEDRYKFLIENTQDVITLQSPDLIYFYASPRIYEVAGHEPEDLLGKSSLDYLHPDDIEQYINLKKEVVSSRESKGVVIRLRNGQGEYRWYETFLKPILDENGALQSYISSSRDVTEKVELSKEIDKVRKKVAQDFHDEMGNNLASISVLSQLIQNKLGSAGQEVEALLNKIDIASKNLFSGTRDFIWAIDPKNDNLREVYYNLKDFGEELFENTGISFYASFEAHEEEAALKLPSGWSRQLVLIFKEAFTNALKYSEAGTVNMCFKISRDDFLIKVSDDGKGFPEQQLHSLRGIRNMRDRSAKIKAMLDIESRPGRGSTIRLKRKITQNGLINVEAKYG